MNSDCKPNFPVLNEFNTYNGKKAYVPLKIVNDKGEENNTYVTHFVKEQYSPFPREGGLFNITSERSSK